MLLLCLVFKTSLRHIILTPSRPVLAIHFYAERQAWEQQVPPFNVFRYDTAGDRTTDLPHSV